MKQKAIIGAVFVAFATIAIFAATISFQTCGGTQTIPLGQLESTITAWIGDGCNEFVLRHDASTGELVGHGYRSGIITPTPTGTPTATPTATPIGQPNVLVSGAGSPVVNGLYTFRGLVDLGAGLLPYYNLVGQPDNPLHYSVVWGKGAYFILGGPGSGNDAYYYTESLSPFNAKWHVYRGAEPVPEVTQSF